MASDRASPTLESLRERWDALLSDSPPEPKGREPTESELAALRAHKARVREFLTPLSAEHRASLKAERKKKMRAESKRRSSPGEEDDEPMRKKEREDADETPRLAPVFAPPPPRPANGVAEALVALLGGERVTYLTRDGSSWIIHARGWMPTPDEDTFLRHWEMHPTEFHALKIFGRTFHENRWSQSWGHSYRYSGTTARARELRENDPECDMILSLIERANEIVSGIIEGGPERPYNGCLQNWYRPDYTIGLHSDDEKDLRESYPIFSLSWGGTRRFVLRARADSPSLCVAKRHDVQLEDGDLLVMGGMCQRTHKHEVPKRRVTMDPPTSDRINWTIRAFIPQE